MFVLMEVIHPIDSMRDFAIYVWWYELVMLDMHVEGF